MARKPRPLTQVRIPTVLGIDPGFASLGYGVISLGPDTETVLDLGLIRTKKSVKKIKVLACDDNFARAQEIAGDLRALVTQWSVVAICAEAMSFPRNASVAGKMALVWGVLADICEDMGIPMQQPTPQRIKTKLCGKNSASKSDVERVVRFRFNGPLLHQKLAKVPNSLREHPVDALAAILACLDGEVLRMARMLAQ